VGAAGAPTVDIPPRASDELLDLARELIRRAAEERPLSGDELFDVEVEGVRCLLLRVHEPAGLPLSPREHEIARMVAQGYPNKTIASVLEISTWTVSTHLRRIFAKLDVHTRAAMVARLVEEGALHPSQSRVGAQAS
jgi:DNA-binding CsgD family transcriptional regulator